MVSCVGLGLYAALSSLAPAIMSELFPTSLRALGVGGAWYHLTVTLFGGTAPLVICALGADQSIVFFWYVTAAGGDHLVCC